MTLPDENPIRDQVTSLYNVWMDEIRTVGALAKGMVELEQRVSALEKKIEMLTGGKVAKGE